MQRALLTVVVVIFWAALYLFVPVLSPYAKHLGASLDLIGVVVGSYGVSQFLLRVPTGWLSDRLGRRRPFVALGLVATAVSCVVMALAPSPWYLVLGRGLSGVGATMWVPLSVMLAAAFPPERAVAAMALASFANNLGQILATVSGGWIADQWGWTAPFVAGAVVAGAGLLLLTVVREAPGQTRAPASLNVLKNVVLNPHLLAVSGLGILVQYTTWVTVFGFTPLHGADLGASGAVLGWLTMFSITGSALAALAADRLTRRFGHRAVIAAGFAIGAVSTAAIPFTATVPVLFGVQFAGGVGRGLVLPLLMGLSITGVPSERRALAMGVFQSLYAIGMFGGPMVAGALGRWLGLPGAFLTTAAVGLLGVAGVWRMRGADAHARVA